MVKCQMQCMSGKIFQVEIHIISKSLIIKSMIEGAFCTSFLIVGFHVYKYHYTFIFVRFFYYWLFADFKWLVLECTIGFISYYLLFKNFWDCWIAVFCLNYIDVCYCVVYTGWAKKK